MGNTQCRGVHVSVEPFYMDAESDPGKNYFFWGYRVSITNDGDDTVQLKRRFWRIVDSRGMVQEVQGTGVVGEQPVLEPGQSFDYASGTPLSMPSGLMDGYYEMTTEGGEPFRVTIPAFSLDSPHEIQYIH